MSKFVVVDEILEQLEAAKSGVVPGSVCQAVVSGVQNVPANIVQHGLSAGGGCYTTFPLSPIMKNCCIDKTYLNLEFDVHLNINLYKDLTGTEGNPTPIDQTGKLPFYIGFRDTASIFNQVQILIENSALTTTTYHREESVIAYNSLPETEIRGNNQYASIEKMRYHRYCPMKRFVIDVVSGTSTYPIDIHYKLTVDINRLTPLLSNMHFTTPHFGNLKLKVWLQRIQEAMFFCPDYNYYAYSKLMGITQDNIQDALAQPLQNQYWSFYPLASFMDTTIPSTQIPFYIISNASNIELAPYVIFTTNNNKDFMTFNGGVAEIVQTCFDIQEQEYQRLSDYFASVGSIIIPTQTFETGVFNNSGIAANDQWIKSQIGTIGGYNVNFVTIWAHPANQQTCFQKEFLYNIQCLLDGRPINSLPYLYVNDKCVVDTTQAIIDTDHEEINADYIASLTCFNDSDDSAYLTKKKQDLWGTGQLNSSINEPYISNPNTFCLNFSTNLPDAFHSGACILENSNRNGIIRLDSSSTEDLTNNNISQDMDKFPYIPTHKSIGSMNAGANTSIVGFTAFCDCCIILTYDPARGTCFDGQISWAAPYA